MPPMLIDACKPHVEVLEGRLQKDQFRASVTELHTIPRPHRVYIVT